MTAAFASLCATQVVLAQTIDVGECTKLKSPGERLDCYERRVEAAEANKAAAPAPTPAPTPAPSSAPSPTAAAPPPAAPTPAPSAVAPAAAGAAAAGAAAAGAAASATPSAAPQPPPAQSDKHNSSSDKAQQTQPNEIVATITELRPMEPNTWLVTLDNHQVWRQSYPQPFLLQPGMQVTLRPSKWGAAYRLSAEGLNGYIQVQRVK